MISSIVFSLVSVVVVSVNYPLVLVVSLLPRPIPSPIPTVRLVITITLTIIHTAATQRIKLPWALNIARGGRQSISSWSWLSIDVLYRRLKSVYFYKWVRQSARKLDQQPKMTYEYWGKRWSHDNVTICDRGIIWNDNIYSEIFYEKIRWKNTFQLMLHYTNNSFIVLLRSLITILYFM
jgi:hypothetical protein